MFAKPLSACYDKELYEHWDIPKAVDILAYTPEEFDRLMLENHFVIDAVQQGVLLYDAASEVKL